MKQSRWLRFLVALSLVIAVVLLMWSQWDDTGAPTHEPEASSSQAPTPPAILRASGNLREKADTPSTEEAAASPTSGTPFRGLVVDHSGEPVPGARISVWKSRAELVETAMTDARGVFEIPCQGRARLCLRADADGYVPAQGGVWLYWGETARLELVRGCAIAVTVRGEEDGEPIAGARVRSICGEEVTYDIDFATHARHTDEAVSDETGHAVVRAVHGIVRIYVSKAGFASLGTKPLHVPPEGTQVSVELVHGRTFAGMVVNSQGGAVVGATVHAKAEPLYDRLQKTDEKGAFEFNELPPRSSHRELVLLYASVRADGFAPYAVQLKLQPEDEGARLRATLTPARVIVGRAIDKHGRPAANVLVHMIPTIPYWFQAERFGDPAATAVTDAAGKFRLEPAAPGGAHLTGWGDPGSEGAYFGRADVQVADTNEPTVVELHEQHHGDRKAHVTVLDPEGKPIDDALVDVSPWGDENEFLARESTNRAGWVVIEGLPSGRLLFNAQKYGFASYQIEVDLTEGDRNDVVMRLPAGAVRGVLRTPDGTPVRTSVHLHRLLGEDLDDWCWPDIETDSEGRFQFKGLGEDTYRISVGSLVIIKGPTSFRASEQELRWTVTTAALAAERQPRLRLRTPQGALIDDVRVRIEGVPEERDTCRPAKDAPGVYLVPHGVASPCRIRVDRDGYQTYRIEEARLQPGPAPLDLVVQFNLGMRLVGTVRTKRGHVLAYAEVRVAGRSTETKDDGTYVLAGLDPGVARVEIDTHYGAPLARNVNVSASGETRFDFVLQGRGLIAVSSQAELPASGKSTLVVTSLAPGAANPVREDFYDVYDLEQGEGSEAFVRQLEPGRYRVVVEWAGARHDLGEVDVTEANDTELSFQPR